MYDLVKFKLPYELAPLHSLTFMTQLPQLSVNNM
jgi:hypothetical protein